MTADEYKALREKKWCAWCGTLTDHASGSCPDLAARVVDRWESLASLSKLDFPAKPLTEAQTESRNDA